MSNFREYLALRLGYTVITLFFVSLLVFLVTQILPGNAATVILGRSATPERVEIVEAQLGLNRPLYVQYFSWVQGIVTGNWGTSFIYNQPIGSIIWERLLRSLQLAIITLTLIVLLGIPLGVLAAINSENLVGTIVSTITYIGISVPSFVRAIILVLLFAGPMLTILPSGGYVPVSDGVLTWASYLILPSLTLLVGGTAHVMRQTRSEMIQTLQADYVRSARIKGVPRFWVIAKHALRNGLLPTVTIIGLQFGWLMGSLVIVEEIFAYPGLGRLVITAVEQRDIPLLQISVLVIATSYALANLVADIVYTSLDPRIEYSQS